MVVPYADKRASRTCVKDVGVAEAGPIDGSIALKRCRYVEIEYLARSGRLAKAQNRTAVSRIAHVGMPDNFMDEIAQMKNNTELL